MICTENYLGRSNAEEILELKQYEENVSQEQINLAVIAWKAFRANTPLPWCELLKHNTSSLPFLHGAVERMLEEYPSTGNGLSRTQNDILDIISKGEEHLGKIFGKQQKCEERVFLGDTVFLDNINEMMDKDATLLTSEQGDRIEPPFSPEKQVQITAYGLEVLNGEKQWFEKYQIDKWLGGVYLSKENIWFWNSELKEIERGQVNAV